MLALIWLLVLLAATFLTIGLVMLAADVQGILHSQTAGNPAMQPTFHEAVRDLTDNYLWTLEGRLPYVLAALYERCEMEAEVEQSLGNHEAAKQIALVMGLLDAAIVESKAIKRGKEV